MKYLITTLFLLCFAVCANAQQSVKKDTVAASAIKPQIVETACGECMFKLKGSDCDLAVRINGRAYFVDGTSIDDHGDAHAKDGFCNAVRKAEVVGKVVDGRFKATSFKLLPDKKP
ncbi:DUF6370 family protein [Pedobacter metabolipauper]|uniref:Glutaminyl-tRNA synthetase n=1 Tax=Pedobacter metabolipauper TaxID=425513 RepID=A0A4R6SQ77_9SPHI|nr:DUF6370 family protein [Pedobacter metabolipauper]TDQ06909.1 hypothetical protein ATK78_3922 [Pedobacter metabolipauper]